MAEPKNPLPVKVQPDRGMIGNGQMVICAGDQTYHIDLLEFFEAMPMPIFMTNYWEWQKAKDAAVLKRIKEARKHDTKADHDLPY